jgi:hypothetical protein
MTRSASTFRQRDVTRAVRATVAAGVPVARFEIEPTGKIVIVAGEPEVGGISPTSNEWDGVNGSHPA